MSREGSSQHHTRKPGGRFQDTSVYHPVNLFKCGPYLICAVVHVQFLPNITANSKPPEGRMLLFLPQKLAPKMNPYGNPPTTLTHIFLTLSSRWNRIGSRVDPRTFIVGTVLLLGEAAFRKPVPCWCSVFVTSTRVTSDFQTLAPPPPAPVSSITVLVGGGYSCCGA